jgi:hypothetical protein
VTARAVLAVAAVTAALTAGCENRYEALTGPPPGLVASLDDESKTIRLTEGVSLAFECFEGDGRDPCARDRSVADSVVAQIFPANLDTLTDNFRKGPQTRSAYVLVGLKPGKTSVTAGGGTLQLTVLATDVQR